MNKRLALITVHGMGDTPRSFDEQLRKHLHSKLRASYQDVHVEQVYYQEILQTNEQNVWREMQSQVRWDGPRKFILFGFADAAGLEAKKEAPGSPYCQSQAIIARALFAAKQNTAKGAPLVILAHSLGCQVVSNYLWDAGVEKGGKPVLAGIWRDIQSHATEIAGKLQLTDEEVAYLRGDSLERLVTTGCNIPIFTAAHDKIVPFKPSKTSFQWKNLYDEDDLLGWPLAKLSQEYGQLVQDIRVNSGGGILGWITKSWNPLSHLQYWDDDEVLNVLVQDIKTLLR